MAVDDREQDCWICDLQSLNQTTKIRSRRESPDETNEVVRRRNTEAARLSPRYSIGPREREPDAEVQAIQDPGARTHPLGS